MSVRELLKPEPYKCRFCGGKLVKAYLGHGYMRLYFCEKCGRLMSR